MTFLKAQWKHLLVINYEIDPALLIPLVPKGTELDFFHEKTYISIVGFRFLDTVVKGLAVPFHRNFEEVNLRFYVKHQSSQGVRRGVVFIKEFVPRRGIAWVARILYNENYSSLPMEHLIKQEAECKSVQYQWKLNGQWHHISAACSGEPKYPPEGSEAEFIIEHYWGYSTQRNGGTMEYQVEHSPWRIWSVDQLDVSIDTQKIFGPDYTPFLEKKPTSAFIADGSEVTVFKGKNI